MIDIRKILILCAITAAAALPCRAQTIDRKAVLDYFAEVLRGGTPRFDYNRRLSPGQTEAASREVWELWRQANAEFEEEQLPRPADISECRGESAFTGSWMLGAEPMQFCYAFKGEKPASGYPLFLCLHGSGDNDREFAANLAWAKVYDDAPSLYFIPRSPKGGTGCRWYQPSRQQAWERLLRQAFLNGDIDPCKVYFFGISEGAYGSQRLASFYADYLAGAGPIAGGEQMRWAPPENCAAIAFTLQTGEHDTMYGRKLLTLKAKERWEQLQAEHPDCYEHKIELQEGRGHGCDYRLTTPWLRLHTRNPYPRYVYWENLPLGNINGEGSAFRDGFYNLSVLERSTDDEDPMVRSCYEMSIEDNVVNLRVSVVTITPDPPVRSDEGWEMSLGESKTYEPATRGRIVIYLNDKLADLSKPVTVKVNGKVMFHGRIRPSLRDLVTSCAAYFDPARLYPASVEVSVE